MTDRIRVFVCYKKELERQDGERLIFRDNTEAPIFQMLLAQDPRGIYEAWVDDAGLGAGMEWETEIYRQLLSSDVLVALIGPGTHKSEGVEREIALATALGISLV